uniref:F-box domain-containing protein n=1 Tax=Caenorhabditis tropicalis TaxID=1561998 RepID=A0A1I7UI37_9PELO
MCESFLNLELDQKTIYDLPIEILENIAEKLDFKSQMTLRRVSRGLRDIVDQARLSIDEVQCHFRLSSISPFFPFTPRLSSAKMTIRNAKKNYNRRYEWKDISERAFNDMKILLSNPRLRLARFEWNNQLSAKIDEKLMEIMNSLNQKLEIVSLDANGESIIDLLKAIKPGTLKYIYLRGKSIDIDQLAQLDQWKKAKSVYIWKPIPDFSLNHFQHFKYVDIEVESFSMDDLLLVKKLFSENAKRIIIKTQNNLSELEIMEPLDITALLYNRSGYFAGKYSAPNGYVRVRLEDFQISFRSVRTPF